jgi:hypothetical protein
MYKLWLTDYEVSEIIIEHLRKQGIIIPDSQVRVEYNSGSKYDRDMKKMETISEHNADDFISVSFDEDELQDYLEEKSAWVADEDTESKCDCENCPADKE